MNDKILRKKVRILKANEKVKNFYVIAEAIGMTRRGFYNWLNEQTNLGYQKKLLLIDFLGGFENE